MAVEYDVRTLQCCQGVPPVENVIQTSGGAIDCYSRALIAAGEYTNAQAQPRACDAVQSAARLELGTMADDQNQVHAQQPRYLTVLPSQR